MLRRYAERKNMSKDTHSFALFDDISSGSGVFEMTEHL